MSFPPAPEEAEASVAEALLKIADAIDSAGNEIAAAIKIGLLAIARAIKNREGETV
jgi:hypothetical protein